MLAAMPIPFWVVALVLAAFAPFGAKALAGAFESRARQRSKLLLATTVRHRGTS